jgi:hypothetical protein
MKIVMVVSVMDKEVIENEKMYKMCDARNMARN